MHNTPRQRNAYIIFFISFLVSTPVYAEAYYDPKINLGNYYFDHSGYTLTGDLFISLLQSKRNVFFSDIRGIDYASTPYEGNFGLGYRHLNSKHSLLVGAYAFFDHRKTAFGNRFNQVTVGGELRTPQ